MADGYSKISGEYYRRDLHPTCYNFGIGNHVILEKLWPMVQGYELICEVGAGKSALLEYLGKDSSYRVLATDSSEKMLEHSRENFPSNFFAVCSAENLPLLPSSVDLIVSLLGDPYNTQNFWREAARVIRPSGSIIFTTPSWEWARSFREDSKQELVNHAFFALESGEEIYVPSYVYDVSTQKYLVEKEGFTLRHTENAQLKDITGRASSVSSKISKQADHDTPVVSGYLFQRTV